MDKLIEEVRLDRDIKANQAELLKLNKSDVTKSVCGDCLYYLICNHESRDKQICDNYDNEP